MSADWQSLLDHSKRPIQWSRSSVIFTAHPTQPALTARHFSSSKQFLVTSPPPILSSSALYLPPSVISVAPADDWLFAFFPGRDTDGIGCIWRRGPLVDNWAVTEWWNFTPDNGVVTATWVDRLRDLEAVGPQTYERLPPRGPQLFQATPLLFVVTQSLQLHAYFFRAFAPKRHTLVCSLKEPNSVVDGQANPAAEAIDTVGGFKVCIAAAIGIGYNEKSVLVATRSRTYPSQVERLQSSFNDLGMDVSLDLPKDDERAGNSVEEWTSWGEEDTIDICEAKLGFAEENITLSVYPLPSVHRQSSLVDLAFVHPYGQSGDNKIFLISSHVQMDGNDTSPKSELVAYSVSRNSATPEPKWVPRLEHTRSFLSGVISFIQPSHRQKGIYIGLLDSSDPTPPKSKQKQVGVIKILALPELGDDEDWEEVKILGNVDPLTRQLPLSAAISPNHMLVSTVSSSLWTSQLSIQPGPKRRSADLNADLATSLVVAVYNRRSTFDLTQSLYSPSVSESDVSAVLEALFRACDVLPRPPSSLLREAQGVVVEILRGRAARCKGNDQKELLEQRWKTVHDACSLTALCEAFDGCFDGTSFDPDAIWQLVGLASWVIGRVEELVRICITTSDTIEAEPTLKSTKDDSQDDTVFHPMLLFLLHPLPFFILIHSVTQVNRLHTQLNTASSQKNRDTIARHTLTDLLDSSGIHFPMFETFLNEYAAELRQNAKLDDARRILATFQPSDGLKKTLREAIKKIAHSPAVDRAKLFIKPHDLIYGVVAAPGKEEKEKDVVTKAPLLKQPNLHVCLRCGGKSEVGLEPRSRSAKWMAWEGYAHLTCICFGSWASVAI